MNNNNIVTSSSLSSSSDRPLIVIHCNINEKNEHGLVICESFSSRFNVSIEFLNLIADPLSRPEYVHEYSITPYSLYAAASLGLNTNDIINTLKRLSKNEIAESFVNFVRQKTEKRGKVKMVLKQHRYFLESIYIDVLKELLKNDIINEAHYEAKESIRRSGNDGKEIIDEETGWLKYKQLDEDDNFVIAGMENKRNNNENNNNENNNNDNNNNNENNKNNEDEEHLNLITSTRNKTSPYLIEFDETKIEEVRKVCSDLGYPILEEYDFRRDSENPDLPISLRPSTTIRPYQEKSLAKIFGNGRARSGIIVLPCGAGKTLVGITTMSTIKKSALIMCTTAMAVDQWAREINKWTNLPKRYIRKFTKDEKNTSSVGNEAVVMITTYSMISYQVSQSEARQSSESRLIFEFITSHQWGLILLDEVQVAPARLFRKCLSVTHSYCKVGLTATLIREDQRIEDLYYLMGPKLYEANWLSLQAQGYIASVECVEVRCPMTPDFYDAYTRVPSAKQRLLYTMNPIKYRAAQYLIKGHVANGDKVMVFSDNVYALQHYARKMKCYFLYGGTSHSERTELLFKFQHSSDVNVLFISKIGDNALDLPDVNVIIQISSHFAARRQEAQRLGRILRPKPRSSSRFNAYFYTLVSCDTKEMFYAQKRQRFLIDQGYAFRVVNNIQELIIESEAKGVTLDYNNVMEQRQLLASILSIDEEDKDIQPSRTNKIVRYAPAKRQIGNLSSLTGDSGLVYAEISRGNNSNRRKKKSQPKSDIFRARQRELKRRRQEQ